MRNGWEMLVGWVLLSDGDNEELASHYAIDLNKLIASSRNVMCSSDHCVPTATIICVMDAVVIVVLEDISLS